MNQQQRKFLIDKIENQSKEKIDVLRKSIPEMPSLSVHILHSVLSGTIQIKPVEQIKEYLRQRALKVTDKSKQDWLGNDWNGSGKGKVYFEIRDLFEVPEEWQSQFNDWAATSKQVNEQIDAIKQQCDNLCLRIQLASDKMLDKLISEIDDLGDISLVDTKMKLLF